MSKSAINIKGRGLTISGFLDTKNMTIETDEFSIPIKLSKICDMAELQDAYVKINISELDAPVTEEDYVKAEEESEDEE